MAYQQIIREMLQGKGNAAVEDAAEKLPDELYGDETRIRQVIVNILNLRFVTKTFLSDLVRWKRLFICSFSGACLKNAFREMYPKGHTMLHSLWRMQIAEMMFQTRSSCAYDVILLPAI